MRLFIATNRPPAALHATAALNFIFWLPMNDVTNVPQAHAGRKLECAPNPDIEAAWFTDEVTVVAKPEICALGIIFVARIHQTREY